MTDYYQRYQSESHAELYAQLKAGDPDQIDNLVSDWVSMEQTLDDIATRLDSDLEALSRTWSSASGDEFRRRIGLIKSYANDLSGEFRTLHEGLSMMSGPLREAQAKAEHPDETDDHDQAAKGALAGSVFGLPGAIVGGIYGHHKDKEEQEKAHQRMVRVVADLAAEYDLNGQRSWTAEPTPVPDDLPGGSPTGAGTNPTAGPTPGSVSPAPTGSTGGPGAKSPSAVGGPSTTAAEAPGTTNVGFGTADQGMGSATDAQFSTTLASADGGGSNTLLGAAWAAGGAGMVAAASGGARSSGTNSQSASLPAGVVTTNDGSFVGGRGPADARSAMAPGRGRPGVIRTPDLGVRSGKETGRSAAMTGARGTNAEEQDERLTWLTEDEMVWQGQEDTAPPVLGTP